MKKQTILSVAVLLMILLTAAGLIGCAGSPENAGNAETSTASEPEGIDRADEGKAGETEAPADDAAEAPASSSDKPAPEPAGEKELKAGSRAESDESGGGLDFMEFEESAAEPAERSGETTRSETAGSGGPPSSSGLQAGFADDNKQYGYFIDFLDEYRATPHLKLDVSERIVIEVLDSQGKSIPNAEIEIRSRGTVIESGRTLSDGSYLFFPSQYPGAFDSFTAAATAGQQSVTDSFTREGERRITLSFGMDRYIPSPIPLDILFIMDTTGSMGEEIERLRTTIELIHLNISNLSVSPRVRFGMVLYKDIGDEYRTKTIPLTEDLNQFQASLDLVEALGGGDTPEDLQAALYESIKNIEWEPGAIKLSFIITDAPPHLDYGQDYTYVDAAVDAKERGIKFFSVGTGGLSINGEYILRQISQYTSGKYIFLTYGEQGESEGGRAGSVSHHTGSNFQTDKLEAIIIRFTKEELSNLTDEPIEEGESYFTARKIDDEDREETLDKLFGMALEQLIDYSTLKIEEGTPTALIPLIAQEEQYQIDAEYFSERLLQQTIGSNRFRVVEREDIQSILDELKLQLSGLTDNTQAVKVGELMHADLLLSGTLYDRADAYEVFLKLLRVESGEILSLTKAKIDRDLGLSDF